MNTPFSQILLEPVFLSFISIDSLRNVGGGKHLFIYWSSILEVACSFPFKINWDKSKMIIKLFEK